jgi:hypothetical protein
MPIPSPRIEIDWLEQAFHKRAQYRLRFVWWPKRCNISGKWLWLCFAYQGEVRWTGPGEPVYETRYHSTVEHMIWLLKGK